MRLRATNFLAGILTLVAAGLTAPSSAEFAPTARADGDHDHGISGGFDSGNLSQGQSWSYVFSESGEFVYHCHPHPSMTGKITVVEDEPSAASGTVNVRIANYSFEPAEVKIQTRTRVNWTNHDNVTHTATQEVHDEKHAPGPALGASLLAVAALILARRRRG